MIVVAGRSEVSWGKDGEADPYGSMQLDTGPGIVVTRMRQELFKVL